MLIYLLTKYKTLIIKSIKKYKKSLKIYILFVPNLKHFFKNIVQKIP